ncbi:hypothetical protein [Deinococcus pimensis]|uniref:hypothetical protein n=1 Tax=Deinococcus pimensis TaxID=309888 RepID=UPI0004845E36|nr:hypothetical protein [Deinococcus pimensis]
MPRQILSNLDFNNVARIVNLPAATAAGQPATFEQLNALVEQNAWKDEARVYVGTNINLAAPGASLDGVTMANGDSFVAGGQTVASENGIYVYNGASTPATRRADANTGAELVSAFVPIAEGTSAGVVFRQTAINITLGTTSVGFVTAFQNAAAASTTTAGVARYATQAEVDAGTVSTATVTPQTLNNWAGRKRKANGTIGDASATQFTVTHNFNTRDVQVEVYRNGTPWDTVLCDVERPDANSVILRFAAAPTAAQFAYVILA